SYRPVPHRHRTGKVTPGALPERLRPRDEWLDKLATAREEGAEELPTLRVDQREDELLLGAGARCECGERRDRMHGHARRGGERAGRRDGDAQPREGARADADGDTVHIGPRYTGGLHLLRNRRQQLARVTGRLEKPLRSRHVLECLT